MKRIGAIRTIGEAFDRHALDAVLHIVPAERAQDRADRGRELKPAGEPSALSAARILSAACGR